MHKQAEKTTRVRTVLNEKQLHTLRTCYAANPRPDALMKEQLVEMTGLSPRVIRVWFQNKRCKDKKKSILMKQLQQQQHNDKTVRDRGRGGGGGCLGGRGASAWCRFARPVLGRLWEIGERDSPEGLGLCTQRSAFCGTRGSLTVVSELGLLAPAADLSWGRWSPPYLATMRSQASRSLGLWLPAQRLARGGRLAGQGYLRWGRRAPQPGCGRSPASPKTASGCKLRASARGLGLKGGGKLRT